MSNNNHNISSSIEIKNTWTCFGGKLIRFTHASTSTNTTMTCSVYLPSNSSTSSNSKVPVLLYLSGLTCTDENVCQKSGVFKYLSENNLALICPDTSPRNTNIEGIIIMNFINIDSFNTTTTITILLLLLLIIMIIHR